EPVAAVRGAALDSSQLTSSVSGSQVTFATGSLGPGAHTLTATLVDAAGNAGTMRLRFTIVRVAHAELVVQLGQATMTTRGVRTVFLVPLSVSTRASVRATLYGPTGRKLRTL